MPNVIFAAGNGFSVLAPHQGTARRLMASTALALAIGFLATGTAQAQTITWDGDTNTDWTVGTNWDSDVAPVGPNDVVIDGGATANLVDLIFGDAATVKTVDISGGTVWIDGTLTTTSGTSVSGGGSLTVYGTIFGTVTNNGGTVFNVQDAVVENVSHASGTTTNDGVIFGTLSVSGDGMTNSVIGEAIGNVTITGGVLENNGQLGDGATDTVTVSGGGLNNNATGIVYGTLTNSGGTVTNAVGGNIDNLSHASGTTTNEGIIHTLAVSGDGMTNNGEVTENVTITGGVLENNGRLGDQTTDTVTVSVGGGLNNNAGGAVSGTLTNSGGTVDNAAGGYIGSLSHVSGTTTSAGDIGTLSVSGDGMTNSGWVSGDVSITAGVLENSGTLGNTDANTVTVSSGAGLNNNLGGNVVGTVANAGTTDNNGIIHAVTNSAGSFTNDGIVTTTVSVTGGTFANSGTGEVGALANNGGTVSNALGGQLASVVNLSQTTTNSGEVVGTVSVTAGTFDNTGTGEVGGALTNNGGTVSNAGEVGALVHNGGTTTNSGAVVGALTVGANGMTNAALGTVGGNTTVTLGTLTNHGTLGNAAGDLVTVAAAGGLNISATGKVMGTVQNAGTTTNAGIVRAVANSAGVFTNSGVVTTAVSVTNGTFANAAAGEVNGTLTNSGGNVTNAGTILEVFHEGGSTINNGEIEANLFVNANGMTNGVGGQVGGDVFVFAGSFSNAGELGDAETDAVSVFAGATFANTATGEVAGLVLNAGTSTNSGSIGALQNDAGSFTNSGNLGAAAITAGTFDNTASGAVSGMIYNGGGVVTNAGSSGVILNGAGTTTNTGLVSGDAFVSGGTFTNAAGADVGGTVVNTGGAVVNAGEVQGVESYSGTTTNSGTVIGSVALAGGTFANTASGLVGGTVANGGGTVTNAGRVQAVVNEGGSMTNSNIVVGQVLVTGGTFGNTATGDVGGLLTVEGGSANNAGEVQAVDVAGTMTNTGVIVRNVTINAGSFAHSGTIGGNVVVNAGLFDVTGGAVAGSTTNTGGEIEISGGLFTGGLINSLGSVRAEGAVSGDITNTGTFVASGDITSGAADTVVNDLGGTMRLVAGGISGGVSLSNRGVLQLGAGRTLSFSSVTNGAGGQMSLTNATVSGALSNQGTLFNSGSSVIAGAFANRGTVDMADGVFGDQLTVTGPLSSGGVYALDVNLTTGETDVVHANGGTAGNLLLAFDTVGGGVILPDTTVFSGLSGGSAYTFSGLPIGGAILYSINDAGGDIFLASGVNPAVPGVAASAAMTQSLIGTVVNRPTSPFVSGLAAEESCSHGGYFRGTGGVATVDGTTNSSAGTNSTSINARYVGAQGGYDFGCFDGRFFNGWDGAAGIMLGYNGGSTEQGVYSNPLDPSALTGVSGSDFKQSYAGLYVAGSKDRISADVQLRYDHTKFDLTETAFIGTPIGLDGLSYGTDTGTVGARFNYRLDVNEEKGINFIPTIGFNYSSTTGALLTLDDAGTPNDLSDDETLEIMPFDTVVGFLGGTLAKTNISEAGDAATTTFISGNFYQDFGGDRHAIYDSSALPAAETMTIESIGGFAEASVGLNYVKILEKGPGGAKQLNANIRADARFGANVRDSFSLTAQLRLSF